MSINDLKFLVDVGVSKKIEEWLSKNGYNVKCVRDINNKMSDREILSIGVSEKRIIMTMDKDFGELIYNSGLPHAGVLLLRLDNANSSEKLFVVENILKYYSEKISNKFCVFQNGRLRIKEK